MAKKNGACGEVNHHMNKANLLLVIIFLSAAFFCAATGIASAITLSDKYVGNTVVDLEWSEWPYSGFSKYELCRDEEIIHTEFNCSNTSYRDEGLSKGNKYNYELKVYETPGGPDPVANSTKTVTTGEVHGLITQSTTWTLATSPYNLIDNVDVREGARLTIENGITVNGHKSVYVDGIRGTISHLNSVTFKGDIHVVNIGDYSIKNCAFTGDITLRQCNGSIIKDTVVNEGAIRIQESHNCKLTYNTGGIELWDSDHNVISNNNCSHSATGFGISCHSGSDNNSISNNVCSYNEIEGGVNVGIIIHSHSHYNEISNNICSHNGYDGIDLMFANNNKLTDNTVDFNGDYGIMVSVSNNNDIDKNRIVDNYNVGVGLTSGSKGNTIGGEGNVIAGNKNSGVLIKGEGTDENLLINNFIGTNTEGTEKLSNEGNGVSISAGAKSNRLDENQISWNKLNGVMMGGEGTNGNIIGSNNEITNNEGNGTCAIGCDVIIEGTGTEIHDNGGCGIRTEEGKVTIHDGAMSSVNKNGQGGIWALGGLSLPPNFVVDDNGGTGILVSAPAGFIEEYETLPMENVKVRNNQGEGITSMDFYLVIRGTNNEIINNAGHGIWIDGGSVTIEGTGTEIHDNGGCGIRNEGRDADDIVEDTGMVTIHDGAMSSVNKNGQGGIWALGGLSLPPNFVVDDNGGTGILVSAPAGFIEEYETLPMENVKVRNNQGEGITSMDFYLVIRGTNNEIINNAGHGIWIDGGSVTIEGTGTEIHDNGGWGIQTRNGKVDVRDATIASNGNGGIKIKGSEGNTVLGNTIKSNSNYGIYLEDSSNSIIYNNYFGNLKNAYDDGTNTWNIAKTKGANIVGGPYLGGNYWSDYDGIDTNGDGLGDTLLPYTSSGSITNGGDYHPLIGSCYTETDTDGDCVDDTVDKCVGIQDATDTCGLPDDCLGYEYCCWTHNFVVEECSPGCELPEHDDCGSGVYLVSKTCVKEGVTCSDDIYEYWNDPDDDDDGWCDELCPTCTCCEGVDNCPDIYNPDQADTDCDGWGDLCDPYPDIPNKVDTATGMGPAIFTSDTGELKKLKAIDEATLPDEGKQALVFSKPTLIFPYGFFSFNIIGLTPGQTVVVTITLPDNVPVGTEYWKYHAAEGGWIQIPMDSDDGDNVITITLVDGGLGDDDGTANGVIVDQGGPGIPKAPPVITSFAPPSPVNDAVCNWRTFNVTVNQTVNVSWYLNNSFLFKNENVREANYTLHAEVVGEHNVSAKAENANGTDMQSWVWHVALAPLPVLEINKTDVPDPVSPGGILNYSIRVNNTGNANATNVIVTETYDEDVTFVGAVPAPSSGDNTWQFPTLNVSETRWINVSVIVNVSVPNGTVLHNIVNASCDEGVMDSDTENTTVFVVPVCVETATGTGIACFATDSGTIEDLVAVDESTLPEEGKPELVFPHGFFSFNITGLTQGQTVVVTLTLPDNVPVGTQYWKYHASEGGWIRIPMGSDDGDNVITITLVDGGRGDDDGTANGVIVDQGGPGVRAAIKPKLTKSAPTSVAPGGNITYTINYTNVGLVALTDVTITENYPKGVRFISAVPAPDAGTNNKWTIGTLPTGSSGQIIIKVKVPDSRDLTFTESGSVTGEGFVMVSKDLSTEQKPYRLKNVVTITCAETDPVTASASTTVSGVPGTSLEITEHGSGIYESEEILNFGTKNKSIRLQKSTEAEYQPFSYNFSDSFSVDFTTRWMQDICSKNMVLGDAMHKKIKDATYIKDDTKTEAGEYGTEMEFASSFHGAAHIGAVSKDVTTSEDYIGEFEIFWAAKEECQYLFNWSRVPGNDSEKLIRFLVDNPDINFYWAENATITKSDDDRIINISTDWHSAEVILAANNETAAVKVGNEAIYVLDVRTEDGSLDVYDCRLRKISESVAGVGYVMVDKELTSGHIQVVEHGSGIYSSDTDFDSQRLNKSTEAEYRPTTFNFSDGFGVNFSSNWVQGICSKDKKAGTAIHKKISDAVSIADDTTATKSSMAFETSFNGSIHVGARTTGTRISEDYIGVFNITERIEIGKAVNASTATSVPDWLPCPFPEP